MGSAALSVSGSITRGIIVPLQKAVALAGRVGGGLRRAGSAVGGAVKGVATGAALATAVVGLGSIKEAISWQEELAKINTIAGYTPDILTDLGESLQNLSIEYGISTQDMASAQYEFLSAGIGLFKTYNEQTGKVVITQGDMKAGAEQQAIALDAASKFSLASLSSQTEAVTVLSFALNAYNLNQKKFTPELAKQAGLFSDNADAVNGYASTMGGAAQVIADQFAKAVEIGVVKGPQIASSFSTVAASAKQAGVGIDEISAAYATQTIRGVSAHRVTTSMNRAILDLVRPGKQLSELMKDTGKNYATIAKNRGLHIALQELRQDAKDAGLEYGTMFKRQEGLRFALNITQDDLQDTSGNFHLYELALRQVQDAAKGTGTAQEQMEKRLDTVGRSVSRVRLAFKILQETIGRPLLQPLKQLLDVIVGIEVGLIDLARTDAGQKFMAQMGPIIGVVAGILSLTAGTQGLLFVLTRVAPMFGATATGLSGLARILGAVALPLGIIIGLLGTFKFLVENNVRGFGAFSENLNDMKRLLGGIITVFQTAAQGIRDVWAAISGGGNVEIAIAHALDQVGQAVENLGPNLEKVMRFVAGFVVSIGQVVVSALAKAIPAIANWVGDVIKAMLPRLAYFAGVMVKWASEMIPKVITALGDFAAGVVRWLGEVIPQVASILAMILRAFINWAKKAVPSILKNLGDLATKVGAWLGATLPVVIRNLGELTNTFIEWAKSVGPVILRWLGDTISGIWTWITRSGPVILAALASWTGAFIDWAASLLPTVLAKLAEFVNGVFTALTAFGNDDGPVGSAMSGAGEQLTKWIGDRLPAAIEALSNWFGQMVEWIFSVGIPRLIGTMAKLAGELLGALDDAFANLDPGGLAEALLKLLGAGVVIAAVMNAGAILGEIFHIAFRTAGLALQGLVSLFGQLVIALAPSAALTGTGLGATMGMAFAVAAAAAIIAAPIAVFAVAIKIQSDIDQQAEDLKAQTIDFTKVASTDELKNSIKGVTEEMNKLPGNAFDARNKVIEVINIMQQEINDREAGLKLDPKAFNNAGTFVDGYTSVLAEATTKAVPEVKSVSQTLAESFNAGFDAETLGLTTFDWREILQEDRAKVSAENITATVSQSFADLAASLSTSTSSIVAGLDKFDNYDETHKPKKGAKPKKFISDADRLKEVNAQIIRAQKDLRAASKAQDTTSMVEIQGIIDRLKTQKTALTNAGKVAGQQATDAATENAKLTATVTAVGGKAAEATKEPVKAARKLTKAEQKKLREELAKYKSLRSEYATEQAKWKKMGETGLSWNDWLKGKVSKKDLPKFQMPEPTINGVPASDYYATLTKNIPNGTVTPIPSDKQQAAIQSYNNVAAGAEAAMDRINARATSVAATTATTLSGMTTEATTLAQTLPSAVAAGISNAPVAVIDTAVSVVVARVSSGLNAMVGTAAGLGTAVTYAFAQGMNTEDALAKLGESIRAVLTKCGEVLGAVSWWSYGFAMVQTLISGLNDEKALADLRAASARVAAAAATDVEHGSPAKHGILMGVPKWGREMAHQFAMGIGDSVGMVAAASGSLAMAAAGPIDAIPLGAPFFSGAREIAPMSMAGRSGYGAAPSMAERQATDRQVELLAEIASTSRLGAAAAAHGASRDPRAGGPLAARSALVSLRQMTTTRTRGG